MAWRRQAVSYLFNINKPIQSAGEAGGAKLENTISANETQPRPKAAARKGKTKNTNLKALYEEEMALSRPQYAVASQAEIRKAVIVKTQCLAGNVYLKIQSSKKCVQAKDRENEGGVLYHLKCLC